MNENENRVSVESPRLEVSADDAGKENVDVHKKGDSLEDSVTKIQFDISGQPHEEIEHDDSTVDCTPGGDGGVKGVDIVLGTDMHSARSENDFKESKKLMIGDRDRDGNQHVECIEVQKGVCGEIGIGDCPDLANHNGVIVHNVASTGDQTVVNKQPEKCVGMLMLGPLPESYYGELSLAPSTNLSTI